MLEVILPVNCAPRVSVLTSMSSGRITTSTSLFSPNPRSTQGISLPATLTRQSFTIVPQRMLLSPMKSATKALAGSL